MPNGIVTTHLEEIIANLHNEIKQIKGRTMKGMIRAAILVRRDMDSTYPKIPVDTGNLRQSWFVVTSKGGTPRGKSAHFSGQQAGTLAHDHAQKLETYKAKAVSKRAPTVIMGFSAYYAPFVHENYGAAFNRPDAGAGFFQAAISRNYKMILRVIKEEAKVK